VIFHGETVLVKGQPKLTFHTDFQRLPSVQGSTLFFYGNACPGEGGGDFVEYV